MNKLIKDELLSLEEYDKKRDDIKLQIIKHKEHRSVKIGENILLLFEDFKTIKYQIQEMLRIEKIFNDKEIDEEISAYSALIPDGSNLKATMLIMYPNVAERKTMLNKLHDIENNIWLSIDNGKRIFAIADEDLERSRDEKTSAVHFLRFELDDISVSKFKDSNNVSIGTDHSQYDKHTELSLKVIETLSDDFS
ncbi:MAG: hypothetical protein CMD43_00395 [Gammaproteobacteria bacterium]|nr:hypothetical protein [Gammaproteobacteria bacterium]